MGFLRSSLAIMVLEMKSPHETSLAALKPVIPVLLCYILSFVYIGIYWNNHHHLLHATQRVNGSTLWANLHLLFWLSLIPFATGWIGENHFEPFPVAVYAVLMNLCGISYTILQVTIEKCHKKDTRLSGIMQRQNTWHYTSLPLSPAASLASAS